MSGHVLSVNHNCAHLAARAAAATHCSMEHVEPATCGARFGHALKRGLASSGLPSRTKLRFVRWHKTALETCPRISFLITRAS